jgi:hypothetical protein
MKKSIDIKRSRVVFSFEGLEQIEFDPSRAHSANQTYAAYHGWMGRLGDMAAISREQKQPDGSIKTITVTEAMRREAVAAGVKHYYSGSADWELRGTRSAPPNPTILALSVKLGKTYEETEAFLADDAVAELLAG